VFILNCFFGLFIWHVSNINKYEFVKADDSFYLNNHPAGIQEVNLNREKVKFHLEENNFFKKPIHEMVRLWPRYINEKEQQKLKQKLKRKKKGKRF
jgi:hypothetical protein